MFAQLLRVCALALLSSNLLPSALHADARTRAKRPAVKQEPAAARSSGALAEAEEALARGELALAVRAFVRADEEDRNMATLVRAFEAASELDDALLIVQVAERILARAEVSDEGRFLARRAIAKASDRLTQLELVCSESACAFEVDGEPAPEGISYFEPGLHEVRVKQQPGQLVQVRCAARAICRLTLPAPEDVNLAALSASTAPLSPREVAHSAQSEQTQASTPPKAERPSRGPLWVFVTSSVGAAALVAAATWTGTRAVQARNLHSSDPNAYDADEVRSYARKTDYLVGGAALLLGTALVTGVWWVDWDARRRTDVSLDGLAGLRATHRF